LTLSDALPVQFWSASQETYNEKDHQGVFRKCFCEPWECTDEIKVQFQQTQTSPDTEYSLLVRDSEGEYLEDIDFTNTALNTFDATFLPNSYGICDEEVQLIIAETDDNVPMLAPSAWTDGASAFDTKTATQFTESITTADNEISATMPFVVPVDTVIKFTYTLVLSGTWAINTGLFIYFSLHDGSDVNVGTSDLTDAELTYSANGTYTVTQILTATAETATLKLIAFEGLASGTALFTLTVPAGQILYTQVIKKSDCLDIKTEQDETVLITYSDNKNYAGLQYSLLSPDPEFYIRIPAIFFHERFPEESEVIELSNSRSIQLNAQTKAQRLMEIKPMPYYMHRKMKLILKHQFVTIDEQDWVQSELYELIESNRRSPNKKATVWLTEKDYILRNVL
jgi:hypothetical protein